MESNQSRTPDIRPLWRERMREAIRESGVPESEVEERLVWWESVVDKIIEDQGWGK